jgi:acetoin utilization deacetylase AcuC-like enzyme
MNLSTPTPEATDALCRLICAYVDLKIPTPEELAFLLPDDGFGGIEKAPAGHRRIPRPVIPTCFSPLYSADTPTASMRKLGPVAWHAVAEGLADIEVPEPVDPDLLRRLHSSDYVDAFLEGREPLASSQGWTWTPQIRDGVLAIHGGQLLGAKLAFEHGIAANIAQGFHHAGHDSGSGYCTFNGLALVAQEFPDKRVMVLDCDQHGGNGTEEFTKRLPNLHNFSINGTPFGMRGGQRSICRTLGRVTENFGLYRQALDDAFDMVDCWRPDLLLYQAGADPHINDPLGSLGMTTEQMMERDRIVFERCRDRSLSVLFVLAGGYQEPIGSRLLPLHLNTFRAAHMVLASANAA